MKKTILFIIVIAIGCFFSSCEEEKTERSDMLKFEKESTTTNDNLAGVAVSVIYTGPQQATARDVSFAVDAANSTAVEGVDYNLASTSLQIAANSSSSDILVDVLQLASGATKKLVLNIVQDGLEIDPAAQNLHTITMVGPVVEFDETEAETYDTIADVSISAVINLIGTTRNSVQTVGFEVIDTAANTAVAGVHYTMVSTGSTVDVAANADETAIEFDIIAGSMETTSTDKELVININRPGDLKVTEDSVFTFTFIAPKVEFIDTLFEGDYRTDSTVANNAGNIDIAVQLVGPMTNVARTIAFEVDSKSTAIAGTQYNIVTASPITIPADEREGIITINVLDGMTPQFEDQTLILKLTNAADLGAGDEDTFTLTIEAP